MLLRGFYFLIVLLVIVAPTWALWLRQPLVFDKGKVDPLNYDIDTSFAFTAPVVFAVLLLSPVFGFAYPQLGAWWNLLLAVVVAPSILYLLWRVLIIVQRRHRMQQIFELWLSDVDGDDFIMFSCNGISRKLLIKDEYIVFSIGYGSLMDLERGLQRDLEELYQKIVFVGGEHFARISPRVEQLKDVVRYCKKFPRAEYLSISSGPDRFRIKL